MGFFLIPILVLQFFYTTTWCKALNSPQYAVNSISDKLNDYVILLPPELSSEDNDILDDENDSIMYFDDIFDDMPMISSGVDKAEVKFRQPIESVNIDYDRNAIMAKFHKDNEKSMIKYDAMDKDEQKFGQDKFMHFNKRSYEQFPLVKSLNEGFINKNPGMRLERSRHQTSRDARGDNFMRFGRSVNAKNDFMRFGRGSNDFMRFGRSPTQNFMRFGRAGSEDNFMRFGRATGYKDFMRFGRTPSQNFMRFGRAPSQNFMRFGRTPSRNFMRFGRDLNQDFMRFGRDGQDGNPQQDFMRFGRNAANNVGRYSRPENVMLFDHAPSQSTENFMHFGKSLEKSNGKNSTQPMMDRNELKQTVKLIHEANKNADNENPVDKAIEVLFDKQQDDQNDKEQDDESHQHENNSNELDSDLDFFLKMSK